VTAAGAGGASARLYRLGGTCRPARLAIIDGGTMRGGWTILCVVLGTLPGVVAMAQPQPGTAPQEADMGASKRLGRRYPAPVPPRAPAQRQPPQVHVSVVSPKESPVHRRRGTLPVAPADAAPAGDEPFAPRTE